jgi:hypothetical protein
MARKKYIYNNIDFDSQEEIDFYYWLEEAKDLGLVEDWEYQPTSFELFDKAIVLKEVKLKTKTKEVERSLLQAHKYTSDYKIWFTDEFIDKFDSKLKNIDLLKRKVVYIDIKGGFGSFSSHGNFSVESKWVWHKYNILVEKLIPDKFFKSTWIPENCRYTLKRKELKKKYLKYNTFKNIAEKII